MGRDISETVIDTWTSIDSIDEDSLVRDARGGRGALGPNDSTIRVPSEEAIVLMVELLCESTSSIHPY